MNLNHVWLLAVAIIVLAVFASAPPASASVLTHPVTMDGPIPPPHVAAMDGPIPPPHVAAMDGPIPPPHVAALNGPVRPSHKA
ncbi:MAG TPA: hypothetical protein VEJ45_09090 [Candidatus Acidoferrales bacterium]|nr:hypothetical protein [Candidatus Acidoferrales bacterium]